ncbi:MAG: glycosyltransferase [Cyanobacteria bacterium J06638_7]
MNILIVTPELPWPPEAGGRASQFATLRALQDDHVFRIVLTREIENLHELAAQLEAQLPHVQVIRGPRPAVAAPRAAAGGSAVARVWARLRRWLRRRRQAPAPAPASPLPERPYYPFVPLPSACIARILSQRHWADLIQAEFHESLFTAFLPLGGIPRLFVCHQAHALFCRRFYGQLGAAQGEGRSDPSSELLAWLRDADSQAASSLESTLLRRFQRVITFTAEDREALLAADAGLPVAVSPFPLPADIQPIAPQSVGHWRQRLVFIGPGHWHPNVEAVAWFCREVRPRLLEQFPPTVCTLHVLGRWAVPLRQSLQGQGVVFHGFVPEPAAEIAGCIALNPVFTGAGLRTKVLLAAACSAVVVSTGMGCEGTGFESGRHCLIADTGRHFAEALARLLHSPSLCADLACNSYEQLMHTFSAEAVRRQRNRIYESLRQEPVQQS